MSNVYPDLRQSHQYAQYLHAVGWQVVNLTNHQSAYLKPLGPLGSLIKIQRFTWPIDLNQLDQLARQHRALFIKLEPDVFFDQSSEQPDLQITNQLFSFGYRPDSWPLLPTKTRIINLHQTAARLLADCTPNCRRHLRHAKKNRLKIYIITSSQTHSRFNLSWFYHQWQQTARRQHLVIPARHHFQALLTNFSPKWFIINCFDSRQQWLAAVVILATPHTAYYYYATSSPIGKQLRAPYLCAWTAILEAKKKHCRLFDFDGIADPRYPALNNSAWQGFSHFKSKFGGREITYPGSFIKYYGIGKLLGLLEKIFDH